MDFEVFTLLPEVFGPYLHSSILLRAQDNGLLAVRVHNIRDFTHDKHHTTDDVPYGGGGGMVMKPGPVFDAVESVLGFAAGQRAPCPIVLLTPQGRLFSQKVATELASLERVALVCGRYEGVDERIRTQLATDEISVGDYVLTGGELPALMVIDAVARLLPGALGNPDGAMTDSHSSGLLEHPHFTRPPEFRGARVPEILLSGDHAKIARWRRQESLRRTSERRRDLLNSADLTDEDLRFLAAEGLYAPD